jgi:hypothetical protein
MGTNLDLPSTKPYLIRAIHQWCTDNGFTPYLAVSVDARTRVPMEHVRDGQIVLNVDYEATGRLEIGNDASPFRPASAASHATCWCRSATCRHLCPRKRRRHGLRISLHRVLCRLVSPLLPALKGKFPSHEKLMAIYRALGINPASGGTRKLVS